MPTISISQEIYEELKKRSQSWEDTPTKIIARLLGLPESKRSQNIWITPDKDLKGQSMWVKGKKEVISLKNRTSWCCTVERIIMFVLVEEGSGLIDPKLVSSETKKILDLNGLLCERDEEITKSGKTILETTITKVQNNFISEGFARPAEGMWLLTKEGLEISEEEKKDNRLLTGKKDGSNQLTIPKVTYRHTRLCFRAELIEGLEAEDVFRIICYDGIFQMTKSEFYDVFDNIVNTDSYRLNGIYHSPKAPRKAMQFKIL